MAKLDQADPIFILYVLIEDLHEEFGSLVTHDNIVLVQYEHPVSLPVVEEVDGQLKWSVVDLLSFEDCFDLVEALLSDACIVD